MEENHKIILKNIIDFQQLIKMLENIIFRGIYDSKGNSIQPYKNVKFSIAKVYPQKTIGGSPEILIENKVRKQVFTPQPTIYQNQIEIIENIDNFLRSKKIDIKKLDCAVEYDWKEKGQFHMLPPIIEKHSYYLKNGFINLENLCERFKNRYIKDARGNLHHLAKRHLKTFYIDEVSYIPYLDIFNSNAPIINYGLNCNGKHDFYIICDGAHRIDYVIETLNKPTSVILIESKKMFLCCHTMLFQFRLGLR